MPQFEQHTQFKLPCSVEIGVCNQCKTRVFCCALYYILSQKIFSFVCCGMRELMPQYAAEHQKQYLRYEQPNALIRKISVVCLSQILLIVLKNYCELGDL